MKSKKRSKTVLVIPDIHNKTSLADKILQEETEVDYTVFLGDYFDDFGDDPKIAEDTAWWLKDRLNDDSRKMVFLNGNHDVSYRFPFSWSVKCSGFTEGKAKAINKVLSPRDWGKFELVHFEGRTIFSHAGISRSLFSSKGGVIKKEKIKFMCRQGLEHAKADIYDPVLAASVSRGGGAPWGHAGVTWLDWQENEPIDGWDQIIGHTPGSNVRIEEDENGWYVACLDTALNHYGVLKNSKLEIRSLKHIA